MRFTACATAETERNDTRGGPRFWRRTRDRLFLAFAAAFVLLAANQMLAAFLAASDELTPYTYVLRVLGFVLILYAIVDKNLSSGRKTRDTANTPRGIAQ